MRKKLSQVKHIVAESETDGLVEDSTSLVLPETDDIEQGNISDTETQTLSNEASNNNDNSETNDSQLNISNHTDDGSEDVVEGISYQLDEHGVGKLPDGTVVVEPMPVDDNAIEKEHQNNGTNRTIPPPSRPHSRSRSSSKLIRTPGVLDFVKCTRCSEKIDPYNSEICVHPHLLVILCKKCHRHYLSNCNFDRDPKDNKDYQCRWCSGYGDLFCCDTCSNSFCVRCIKRNLGRSALSKVRDLGESDFWECYVCQPAELEDLRKECKNVLTQVANFKELQQRRFRNKLAKVGKHSLSGSAGLTTGGGDSNGIKTMDDKYFKSVKSDSPSSIMDPSAYAFHHQIANNKTAIRRSLPIDDSTSSTASSGQQQQLRATLFLKTSNNFAHGNSLNLSNSKSDLAGNGPPPYKMLLLTAPSKVNATNNLSAILPKTSTSGGIGGSGGSGANGGLLIKSNSGAMPNVSLPWLFNEETVNTAMLRVLVSGALRGVASFYKEMHRLYVAVHKPDFGSKKTEILDDFRNSFYEHFVQRLGRLPHHLTLSDALTNSATLASLGKDVKSPTSKTKPSTGSVVIASAHRPAVVIDLTDEMEELTESKTGVDNCEAASSSPVSTSTESGQQKEVESKVGDEEPKTD